MTDERYPALVTALGRELAEEMRQLFLVLGRHISASHRCSPALDSLDDFCELLLVVLADSKDRARIRIASRTGGDVWIWMYNDELKGIAVECTLLRDRGEYGMQVSRWALVTPQEVIRKNEKDLARLFVGYAS